VPEPGCGTGVQADYAVARYAFLGDTAGRGVV
jgi:hypothetical protein